MGAGVGEVSVHLAALIGVETIGGEVGGEHTVVTLARVDGARHPVEVVATVGQRGLAILLGEGEAYHGAAVGVGT